MSTRFRLGISALALVLTVAPQAVAQGAVQVFGGGLGKACYDAAENARMETADAIKVCDLAIDTESMKQRDRAATYTNRGILYMRQGNNARALRDYERGLQMMPDLREAKVNLGAALYNLKRYPEALAALNDGVGTESVEAKAIGYYNRGLTHEKLGDLQSAYEDFRRALRTKPEFDKAAAQMARFTVVPVDG